MRIVNDSLDFDSTDLSQSACTSNPFWLGHMANYAVQIVVTGSPVGTFKVQFSCDRGPRNSNGEQIGDSISNWSDLPSATMAVSAAGTYALNIVDAGYNWVRVVYTKTSGTGAISSARVNAKGV